MTRRRTEPEGWVGLIAAIVEDAPRLEGAACVGQSELFDARGDGEPWEAAQRRQQAAQRICRWACPAEPQCVAWFESLVPAVRPRGVVAGVIPGDAPPGRPKSASA